MAENKTSIEQYFKNEIQRVSRIEIEKTEQEIKLIQKKALASSKLEVQQIVGMEQEEALRELQREHAVKISKIHEKMHRNLMEQRQSFTDAIFASVLLKLESYTMSDAYEKNMIDKIERLQEKNLGHICIFVGQKDAEKLENLCHYYKSCEGAIDNTIHYGGIRVEASERGIVIDESIDTFLEEEKVRFYQHSGLFI